MTFGQLCHDVLKCAEPESSRAMTLGAIATITAIEVIEVAEVAESATAVEVVGDSQEQSRTS